MFHLCLYLNCYFLNNPLRVNFVRNFDVELHILQQEYVDIVSNNNILQICLIRVTI